MKTKQILMMTLMVLIIFMASIPLHAEITPNLTLSDTYITPGELFNVDVFIQNPAALGDLTGFGFDVNSTNISFLSWNIGTGFVVPQNSGISLLSNHVEGLKSDPSDSNTGDYISLARLFFQAGSEGQAQLNISGIYNGTYLGLFYEGDPNTNPDLGNESLKGSLDFYIHAPSPIPEPGTFLLVAIGLTGIAGLGRKKKINFF